MPERPVNISSDIVRTLIAISETGSFSKAGKRLGLSQPAISAQLKRIQRLLGDPIFRRSASGSRPTAIGALVLDEARRMMDANDAILRICGGGESERLRLGVSSVFVDHLMKQEAPRSIAEYSVVSEGCSAIARAFGERRLDFALMFDVKDVAATVGRSVIRKYEIPFAWVRTDSFTLSPGRPLPLAVWPGDDFALRTLTGKGQAYRLVFSSPDFSAKLAAAKSGNCLTVLPRPFVAPPLVEAEEDYLPELGSLTALLCARPGLDPRHSADLISRMSSLDA